MHISTYLPTRSSIKKRLSSKMNWWTLLNIAENRFFRSFLLQRWTRLLKLSNPVLFPSHRKTWDLRYTETLDQELISNIIYQLSIISNRMRTKSDRIVIQVNMHRLTESDFWYHVVPQDGSITSFRAKKVLLSGECTRSVCPAHMEQRPPVPEPQYIRTCFTSASLWLVC